MSAVQPLEMWIMRFIPLTLALAVVLSCAIIGSTGAFAAPATASPTQALALGNAVTPAEQANVAEAGVSVYIGPRRRYYRHHYYYRPYYYHRRYYYRPYYSHRRHYRKRHHGRCGHWRAACARNWGVGNSDYYGCLRYHGC